MHRQKHVLRSDHRKPRERRGAASIFCRTTSQVVLRKRDQRPSAYKPWSFRTTTRPAWRSSMRATSSAWRSLGCRTCHSMVCIDDVKFIPPLGLEVGAARTGDRDGIRERWRAVSHGLTTPPPPPPPVPVDGGIPTASVAITSRRTDGAPLPQSSQIKSCCHH